MPSGFVLPHEEVCFSRKEDGGWKIEEDFNELGWLLKRNAGLGDSSSRREVCFLD